MISYKYGVGISYLEFWVKDMEESLTFYSQHFPLIGWHAFTRTSFGCGVHEIYFKEAPVPLHGSMCARHISFHATSRAEVDAAGAWLQNNWGNIIRGPQQMPQYDKFIIPSISPT